MAAPAGRREASKQATRAALLAAAKAEFAARGFEAATVRDIASAAGVTERTFYLYFDGKEGLIHEEFTGWLELLHRAILARPAAEPPLTAVQRAMLTIGRTAEQDRGPAPLWLFSGRSGLRDLRRTAPRPLRPQLESSIAAAVLIRLGGSDAAAWPPRRPRVRRQGDRQGRGGGVPQCDDRAPGAARGRRIGPAGPGATPRRRVRDHQRAVSRPVSNAAVAC